jgi:hypothetical protein
MESEIENRINGNLERVEHLVAPYETVTTGSGRRAVDTSCSNSVRKFGTSVLSQIYSKGDLQ